MRKHRRLLWSLGLIAVLGLITREAGAAPIFLTVSTNGGSTTITGSSNAVSVTSTLNTFLHNNLHSAYQFASSNNAVALGGTSSYPGTVAGGGSLSVGGTLIEDPGSGHMALGNIVITVTEGGFINPPVQQGLEEGSTAQYTNTTKGDTQQAVGTWMGSSTVSLTLPASLMTSTGPGVNNYSPMTSTTISGTGTYSLTEAITINLALAPNATNTFGGTVKVTGVPEPASVVMLLTAMPLPLALVGLLCLRRRRALAQG